MKFVKSTYISENKDLGFISGQKGHRKKTVPLFGLTDNPELAHVSRIRYFIHFFSKKGQGDITFKIIIRNGHGKSASSTFTIEGTGEWQTFIFELPHDIFVGGDRSDITETTVFVSGNGRFLFTNGSGKRRNTDGLIYAWEPENVPESASMQVAPQIRYRGSMQIRTREVNRRVMFHPRQ